MEIKTKSLMLVFLSMIFLISFVSASTTITDLNISTDANIYAKDTINATGEMNINGNPVSPWLYNQTGESENIFDQELNTSSNATFANITITNNSYFNSDLNVRNSFFANIIGSIVDRIVILWVTTINAVTLNANSINATNVNVTETINVTGELNINNAPVSIWLHNQTQNIFDQQLNTTSEVQFDNLTIANNVTIANGLSSVHFTTNHQHTPQNNLRFNWYDDGSEIFLNTSGIEAFNIESENAKLILFDEPKPANDFKLFQVFNKQAQTETEFVVTQAGNTLTSYFIRSLSIVGNGSQIGSPFNCSTFAEFIDCNTDISGPDFYVLDDVEINGSIWIGTGNFHVDDNGNLIAQNITSIGNLTTTNLTLLGTLSCTTALETNANGDVICGTDPASATGNVFDQILNTTYNVTFANITITRNSTFEANLDINGALFIGGIDVGTWLHNQTQNIFNQQLNTTSNVIFSNLTLINGGNLTVTNISVLSVISCSEALETDSAGIIFCGTDETGGAGGNPFDQVLNISSNVTFANITIANNSIFSGDLEVVNSFFADIIGSITDRISSIWASAIDTFSINANSINSSNIKVTETINITGEVNIGNSPVSPWLYNQTFSNNIFNQQLNTTNNVIFGNITSLGNLTITGNVTTGNGNIVTEWNGTCENTYIGNILVQSIGCQ